MSARRPAESLLDEIAESALDDDYYLVRAGETRKDRSANTIAVGVVMVLFALLVTVAALQSALDRPGRILERTTMIRDVENGRASISESRERIEDLEGEIRGLGTGEATGAGDPSLDVVVGARAVDGPGVAVTLRDAEIPGQRSTVTARDLRIVVNELWYAGAEAVAIGDQRLTTTSAVTSVDGLPQVNYRPVGGPVVVTALGDARTLADRLTAGAAGRHLQRRSESDGLGVDVTSSDDLELPGAPRVTQDLKHATTLEEDR